ncbi:phlebovirus glycoprotein g2 domain-containing protein [Ditylenchus destructor]|uniref:Phlebovirus glycoprotein g2 domain-containing protein n=1 Tax=Ditylenchus destructor TaxID=166010 RepID=A0AAD4N6N3_9BILA|nr:phlebovirus glycoprotein g2 domain-containing protein [Ditylenchus destructor]
MTYFAQRGVQWKFIPTYSPWEGSVYERLIGVSKQCIRKAIGKKLLNIFEISTFLAETAAVVNSRPLSYLGSEFDNTEEIIRPIDFLISKRRAGTIQLNEDDDDEEWLPSVNSQQALRLKWQHSQRTLDRFWKLWECQYLQSLRERYQTKHQQGRLINNSIPEVDEIVLIKDANVPRGCWKLGKIIEVPDSQPYTIRTAKVRTPTGKVFTRSIRDLYSLEIKTTINSPNGKAPTSCSEHKPQTYPTEPPKAVDSMVELQLVSDAEDEHLHRKTLPLDPPGEFVKSSTKTEETSHRAKMEHSREGSPRRRKSRRNTKRPDTYGDKSSEGDISPTPDAKRKSKNFTGFSMMSIIFLTLIHGLSALNTKCPTDHSHYQLAHRGSCVDNDIAIFQKKKGFFNSQLEYCWIPLTCNKPTNENRHLCSRHCSCPSLYKFPGHHHASPPPGRILTSDWLRIHFPEYHQCSHYIGPHTNISSRRNSKFLHMMQHLKPDVCSLVPTNSSKCSTEPVTGLLAEIILYDHSHHLVNSLTLKKTEFVKEEYDCIGNGLLPLGTPEYCQQYTCYENGTKFCFYGKQEMVELVYENWTIPIKAWDSVYHYYFPYRREDITPMCSSCKISCATGGLLYQSETSIASKIEVCINGKTRCLFLIDPKPHEHIPLSIEELVFSQTATLTVWTNGEITKNHSITCSANPICELIECRLCLQYLKNPQCFKAPELTITQSIIVLGTLLIIIYIVLKQCAKKSLTALHCIICLPYKKLCHKTATEPTNPAAITRKPKPATKSSRLRNTKYIYVILALTKIGFVETCSKNYAFTALQKDCVQTVTKGLQCSFHHNTVMDISPGYDACLLLQDNNNATMSKVTVKIEELRAHCRAKSEYFTRSYAIKTTSMKRCAGTGSCKGLHCEHVQISDYVTEFDQKVNNAPGHSYCAESCGCWGCGCFLCENACLYYRNYAVPTSRKVYEVVSCDVWPTEVTIRIIIEENGKPAQIFRKITQGNIPFKVGHFTLSVPIVSLPPLPVLGSQFLVGPQSILRVRASDGGQPIAGTIGDLQCLTRGKARRFDCTFPPHQCRCHPAGKQANCVCAERSLEELIQTKKDYLLPLRSQGLTITGSDSTNIRAKITSLATLQVKIRTPDDGLTIATMHQNVNCHVKNVTLSGCYQCHRGALLTGTCYTDNLTNMGRIMCGSKMIVVQCTKAGTHFEEPIHFPQSQIEEECEIICSNRDKFTIRGSLAYVEAVPVNNWTSDTDGHLDDPPSLDTDDLPDPVAWAQKKWQEIQNMSFIMKIVIFACIILAIFVLCSMLLSFTFTCFPFISLTQNVCSQLKSSPKSISHYKPLSKRKSLSSKTKLKL